LLLLLSRIVADLTNRSWQHFPNKIFLNCKASRCTQMIFEEESLNISIII
jgi:hypothetical protein